MADERPGIFYASEHEATAITEIAYWQLVFLSRSPGLHAPRTTTEHSAFTAEISAERSVDLTTPPFVADASKWTSNDYRDCQQLALAARTAACQSIRYRSARDPDRRANLALLDPTGFASAQPRLERSWHLRIEAGTVIALAAFPSDLQLRFSARQFGITLG
jgi:hypothetical protein